MMTTTQRELCDTWFKNLSNSQRFVVELTESMYDLTTVEVMEWIEAGLLKWKRVRNEAGGWSADGHRYSSGCWYWCLVEAE